MMEPSSPRNVAISSQIALLTNSSTKGARHEASISATVNTAGVSTVFAPAGCSIVRADAFIYSYLFGGGAACGGGVPALSARATRLARASAGFWYSLTVSFIATEGGRRYEFEYEIAPDGQFYLPGTLAIVEGKKARERVDVSAIGIRGQGDEKEARVLAKVVTTLPESRLAMLNMPM